MQSTAALVIWAAASVAVPAPATAPAATAATAATAAAAATAEPTAAAARPEAGEPTVQLRVAEDDHVRIEEVRVRGESQRIVVKPKTAGAKEYEIEPSTGASDPSQRHRRAAGERVWRIFSF